MLAYNKESLKKLLILKKIDELYSKKLLTEEQYQESLIKYNSGLYTPEIYKKIWVFIYVAFAIVLMSGIINRMASLLNDGFHAVISLICSFICFATLEYTIKTSNHYKSGRHQAFLYCGLLFLIEAFISFFGHIHENNHSRLLFSLSYLPILIIATIRYCDSFVAILLNWCFYTISSLLILKIGSNGKFILPYALMLLSIIVYIAASRLKEKKELLFWKDCLSIFEIVALIVFYAAGNYYMIKVADTTLINIDLLKGEVIPLPIVFVPFTALVPLLYVYFGLKKKSKVLLWLGLLFILPSVFSFMFYYRSLHTYISLIIGSFISLAIALGGIIYFKTPKYGIVYKNEDEELIL